MKRILYYLKIWWMMSKNSFLAVFYTKLSLFIFLTGKILRFLFFVGFLFFLVTGAKTLGGYSVNQAIFFFLTFNIIDVFSQFMYREVYRFRPQVVSGNFDLILIKPVSVLFRSLMGGADVIDLITIPPLIFAVLYIGNTLSPTLINIILYVALLINGFLISTAFHIAVLALGIITLEVDHTIMIYRDFVALGRLPVDIYKEPVKSILTFLLPVGIMVTFPAKVFMGLVTPQTILVSFFLAFASLFLAHRFWKFALKFYTSASS